MRHIIKKQIIELSLDKRLNYFHVQQQVSDRYWNEIVPILVKSFDSIGNEEKLIEIDRLELDLGVISEKDLGSRELIEKIRRKIEQKVTDITDPRWQGSTVRIRDPLLGVFEQWEYYMEHGYLSWNSEKPEERWYKDVLDILKGSPDSRSILRNKLQDQHFLNRVVYLHNDRFLQYLTEIISGEGQEKLQTYIYELLDLNRYLVKKKKIKDLENDNRLKYTFWQKILKDTLKTSQPANLKDNLILSYILEKKLTSKLPDEVEEKFPHIIPVLNKYLADIKIQRKKEKMAVEKAIEDMSLTQRVSGQVSDQISGYNANAPDEEGIFIMNAGMVLLHPFLKNLFTRLDLVKDNHFIDENARVTCIYLIHYLGTGRTEAEEYELTLAKLLCAFPLGSPVEPVTLEPEFISEADRLIEAALDQWSILKNTSSSGLREGFLQRPGKLFSKNANIYLRVERNSIDVLLDYLPWNLSIIMLPWMKDVLRVEWR